MNNIDFLTLKWQCHICKNERTSNQLKMISHDFSQLFDMPTGCMFINCRYCNDNDGCHQNAINRDWLIENVLKMMKIPA